MRRLILALLLALLAAFGAGTLAPPAQAATTMTAPAVTVTPTTVAVGGTVTVHGTGFTPNYYAYVFYQRPDGTTNALYVQTDAAGAFTFTLGFLASHGTGTEYLSAYDFTTHSWTATVAITVTGSAPPPAVRQLSASPNPAFVGATTTVSGTGFSPNNYVYVTYRRPDGTSNAVYVFTNPNGTFAFTLGFLRAHGCGPEYVQAYDFGMGAWSNVYTITVTGC